jgi:hypothetical protein
MLEIRPAPSEERIRFLDTVWTRFENFDDRCVNHAIIAAIEANAQPIAGRGA